MTEQFANASDTTLSGAINNSVTSLAVAAGATFPSSGDFRIRIDDELIIVGARSSNTLSSLTRGAEGSTAASHSNGATVTHVLTAASLGAIIEERLVAADVTIADAGNFYTTDNVEAALQQLGLNAPFVDSIGASATLWRTTSSHQTIAMGEEGQVGGVDGVNYWQALDSDDPWGFFGDIDAPTHKATQIVIPDFAWAGTNIQYLITATVLLHENPTSGSAVFSLVDADGGSYYSFTDPDFQDVVLIAPGAVDVVYALMMTTPPLQLGVGDIMYLYCDNTNGGSDCTIVAFQSHAGNDPNATSLGIARV